MDPPENIDKDREMAEMSFKIADKQFITDVARKIFEAGVAVGEKARARALPEGDQAMDAEDATRRARLSEAYGFLSRIPRGKYGILRIMPHPYDFSDEQSYVEFCNNDTNYQIHKRVSAKHRDRIGDAHGFNEHEFVLHKKRLLRDLFCWARHHATPRDRPGRWSLSANPPSMNGPDSKQLKPFQLEDVGYINYVEGNWGCGLLEHEMGLGKTLMGIAIAELDKGLTIIVCPASLVQNWKTELASNVYPPPKVRQYTAEQRRTMMPDQLEHVVCPSGFLEKNGQGPFQHSNPYQHHHLL